MRTLGALLFCLTAVVALAAPARASGDEEEFDALHHTSDGNYLDYEPFGKVELPRLFVVRRADGSLGFDGFPSSTAAVASGKYRIAAGAHGSEGDEEAGAHDARTEGSAPDAGEVGTVGDVNVEAGSEEGHAVELSTDEEAPYDAALAPADGGSVLIDLSITRHTVYLFLAVGLLALLLIPIGGRYKKGVGRTSAPRGLLQNMLETLVVYVRDEIAKPNLGDKHRRYLPYLLTAFFFILTANLLGLVPFGATATANIAVTTVLAVATFLVTQFAGTKDYWKHIFWPPGIPTPVKLILIPVEILGLFTKPFALAVRLFANMTAGHLVILNLVGLIFIIGGLFGTAAGFATGVPAVLMTLFVYGLELLVAFIQAYVFTTLSALFIGMASAEHEHHHDDSHHGELTAHEKAVSLSTPLISNGKLRHENGRTVGTEEALSPF